MTIAVAVKTTAKAPRSVVWEIISDFQNVHEYTSQVKTTEQISENAGGIGASRACSLAPMGSTQEDVLEWEDNEKLVVELHDTKGIPVKGSRSTFSLREIDENTTEISFSAQVEPKGGALSGFIGKRLAKRLPKGAQAMLDDFAAAAEKRVSAA